MPLYTPNDRELEQFKNNFILKEVTTDQQKRMLDLREHAKKLGVQILAACPAGREKSLAMTALQEAIVWADAAITVGEKGKPLSINKDTHEVQS